MPRMWCEDWEGKRRAGRVVVSGHLIQACIVAVLLGSLNVGCEDEPAIDEEIDFRHGEGEAQPTVDRARSAPSSGQQAKGNAIREPSDDILGIGDTVKFERDWSAKPRADFSFTRLVSGLNDTRKVVGQGQIQFLPGGEEGSIRLTQLQLADRDDVLPTAPRLMKDAEPLGISFDSAGRVGTLEGWEQLPKSLSMGIFHKNMEGRERERFMASMVLGLRWAHYQALLDGQELLMGEYLPLETTIQLDLSPALGMTVAANVRARAASPVPCVEFADGRDCLKVQLKYSISPQAKREIIAVVEELLARRGASEDYRLYAAEFTSDVTLVVEKDTLLPHSFEEETQLQLLARPQTKERLILTSDGRESVVYARRLKGTFKYIDEADEGATKPGGEAAPDEAAPDKESASALEPSDQDAKIADKPSGESTDEASGKPAGEAGPASKGADQPKAAGDSDPTGPADSETSDTTTSE